MRKIKIIVLPIMLSLVICVSSAYSFMISRTGNISNLFKFGFNSGEPAASVSESVSSLGDFSIKQNIAVTNNGNVDEYVKLTMTLNWVDEDGKVYPSVNVGQSFYIRDYSALTASTTTPLTIDHSNNAFKEVVYDTADQKFSAGGSVNFRIENEKLSIPDFDLSTAGVNSFLFFNESFYANDTEISSTSVAKNIVFNDIVGSNFLKNSKQKDCPGWFLYSSDQSGTYTFYYTEPIAPGESTPILFDNILIPKGGKEITIDDGTGNDKDVSLSLQIMFYTEGSQTPDNDFTIATRQIVEGSGDHTYISKVVPETTTTA